jgi:hypothetical protein
MAGSRRGDAGTAPGSLAVVTHYEVLGVARHASGPEIRRSYLDLARRHHPDRAGSAHQATAEDRMRAINEAWAVLGDQERRRRYDEELVARERSQRRPNAPSPGFVPLVDDDTDYAALLDDTPTEGTSVPRPLQLAPAVLFGVAVVAGAAGMVMQATGLLAVGVIAFIFAVLALVAAPVYAVFQSRQHDLP